MLERKSEGSGVPVRLVLGLLLWLAAAICAGVSMPAVAQVQVSAISDTVYYADGSAASGTVLVSWPAFTTASGQSVPKGSSSIVLGTGGKLNVSLAPNAGATPAGTYYTVVYHLGDGSTSSRCRSPRACFSLAAVRSNALPTRYRDSGCDEAVCRPGNRASGSRFVSGHGHAAGHLGVCAQER